MRLNDSVKEVLEKYKYSNLPLEQTMQKLTEAGGYWTVTTSKREDLAHLLCEYKWNRLTKESLSKKIQELDCFQESTVGW